jgi:hypothetical protein
MFNTSALSTAPGIVNVSTNTSGSAPTSGNFVTACLTNTNGVLATSGHCNIPIQDFSGGTGTTASYFDLGTLILDVLGDSLFTARLSITGSTSAPDKTTAQIINTFNTDMGTITANETRLAHFASDLLDYMENAKIGIAPPAITVPHLSLIDVC